MDPFVIGGLTISGLNLATTWVRAFKDFLKWEEKDLLINMEWLSVALEKGALTGTLEDYAFMRADKVPTAELKGEIEVVLAVNEDKRIKYRLLTNPRGTPSVLVKKLQKAT